MDNLESLTQNQLLLKAKRLLAACEYYAIAEKVLVTHHTKNTGSIQVKLTRPDNGSVAKEAINFDPTKANV